MALSSDASAPAAARRHARDVLRGWQVEDIEDSVLLILSELVTNAVQHGRPPVLMTLRLELGFVRVSVRDEGGPVGPLPELDADSEQGRGRFLVDALSARSGVTKLADGGNLFWSEVACPQSLGSEEVVTWEDMLT